MTSEGRTMPNHPTRKCACGAQVKLIAKYCLKHGEQLRNLRGRLSMLKNSTKKEIYIEKYVNLYNFLNRCDLRYGEGIREVNYKTKTNKK